MRLLPALLVLLLLNRSFAAEPPVIPVGIDAYRQWEKWPLQRIGQRTYMRSTYDRRGGNEGADASHFLYQLADDNNVTLDLEGPGVLAFARYNHWHGSPWRYVIDGDEHIVQETSTADPNKPVKDSVFEPREAFPPGLTYAWSTTKGADLSWVPIEFQKSFRMGYSRTHYGTGYYIFHRFVPGIPLSRELTTWTPQSHPHREALDVIASAGSRLVPDDAAAVLMAPDLPAEGAYHLTHSDLIGRYVIRGITITAPQDVADDLAQVRLRITWDGRQHASVDAPLALFFGAGTFYNRDGREWLVKSLPMTVRFAEERIHLACYFPMPFFKSARIELVSAGKRIENLRCRIDYDLYEGPSDHVGYFHATYRDHATPERGKDLVLLDTTKTEGGGDWSGSFVGTSFIFSHNAELTTLEGDPRFFFDDAESPQAYGTGTEEWGGGGDYWGGRNMTLAFAGHPCGAPSRKEAKNDLDKIQSAYRFLLGDLFPFGRNARIQLEHGGTNESKEHYETVTYWYGLPAASIVKTDTLQLGDAESEKAHEYVSLDASQPLEIESRFEWGVDKLGDQEIYPPLVDKGRTTTGTSEFTLKLDKGNVGVMLRRKLDYPFPNQRAEVSVQVGDEWQPAGVWYLAGSNTCVYSNPKEELGATQHNVQTSNRRFREDEFLVPLALTKGRESIRVRVKFTPVKTPLYPGAEVPKLAWSEIRYDAYCFVMPKFSP
jgi:hypothetical protein